MNKPTRVTCSIMAGLLLHLSALECDGGVSLIRPRSSKCESVVIPSGHVVTKPKQDMFPSPKGMIDNDNSLIALVNMFLVAPGENVALLEQIKMMAASAHFDQGTWDIARDFDMAQQVNPHYITPLMFYALIGDRQRVENELANITKPEIRKYDRVGANVLCYAVLNTEDNAVAILKELIEEFKIPVHQQLANKWNLLMIAVQNPSDAGVAMVKYLLGQDKEKGKAKVHVNEAASDGTTPMMVLLDHNYGDNVEDMIKVLLDAGARVNNHSSDGVTELMVAAGTQSPAVVSSLLNIEKSRSKEPARVNTQDKQGLTALHYAIEFNNDDNVAKTLLDTMDGDARIKRGHQTATVNLQTKDGNTSLDTARSLGRTKVVKMLTAGGIGGLTQVELEQSHGKLSSFQYDAGMGRAEAVRNALKGGKPAKDGVLHRDKDKIDINRPDMHGCTPLHLAIRRDDKNGIETAEVLLEDRMINVNARDVMGRTPLMFAVMGRNARTLQLVERLLQAGADAALKDDEGRTALMHLILAHSGPLAAERVLSEETQLFIAQALIDASSDEATQTVFSDLKTKDNHGFSALDYANSFDRDDLVALIEAGIAQQPVKKAKK